MIKDLLDAEVIKFRGKYYTSRQVRDILRGDTDATTTVKSYMTRHHEALGRMSDDELRDYVISKFRRPNNVKLGHYMQLFREHKNGRDRTVTITLRREELDRLMKVTRCDDAVKAVVKAVERFQADHPFPCPECGGPSMCVNTTMRYECFQCGHKWSGATNRALKAKVNNDD